MVFPSLFTQEQEERDPELQIFDFSHYPLPCRTQNTLRIFYNNVNGLEINKAIDTMIQQNKIKHKEQILQKIDSYTKIEALIQQMQRWEVNLTALAEPCIEWRDNIPRKILNETGKKYDRYGHWTVATSKSTVGSFVKPGGALLYTDGDWSSRIIEAGTDPWGYGRWAYKRFQGKGGLSLLIVSAYRVTRSSSVQGPTTAWYQQQKLIAQDKRIGDPADLFLADLEEWITHKISPKVEVMILLDANEKWTPNAGINKFAERLQLLNLDTSGNYNFPASHPCIANPSRNTTIDFCLCSDKVLDCIQYATRTPYDLGCLGDHRGMIIDIDMHRLCQEVQESTPSDAGRKLVTSNPAATKKYLELVQKYFGKQNIFSQANTLFNQWQAKKKSRWDIHRKYEILDKEIFDICRKAERNCRPTRSGTKAWSPTLARAIKQVAYWRARKKYPVQNALINKLGQEIDVQYEDLSTNNIEHNLQQSRQELHRVQEQSIHYRKEHLHKLAERYATENNLSNQKAVQELLLHESVKATFSVLKEKLKPHQHG